MIITPYLIVDQYGFDRALKTEPGSIKRGEFCFQLSIDIPDAVFERPKPPMIEVRVPMEAISAPSVKVNAVPAETAATDEAFRQVVAIQQLGRVLEAAKGSKDKELRELVKNVVTELMDAGIEVRLTQEA